jgi:outer membrane protein insertion porin family
MFAKQTSLSAAIVVGLGGAASADDGRGTFQIGAGYHTDEGFIASASIETPDLLGTGLGVGEYATLSARRQLFDAKLDVPGLARFDLYNDMQQLPGFTRKAVGLSMRHTMQVSPHVTAWVGYRLEQVSIDRDSIERSIHGPPDAAGLVSAVTTGFAYHGEHTQLGAYVDYADPRLGSEHEIGTIGGWIATHQPAGPFVLHLSGAGTVIAATGGVPMSERLFLDGSYDVRGYGYGAFGPVGGGTQKLVGHASLELPVGHGVSVEGFIDYARISNMEIESPIGTAHASGMSRGFGLIWKSPLGPIHADVAYPLDGPPSFFIAVGP